MSKYHKHTNASHRKRAKHNVFQTEQCVEKHGLGDVMAREFYRCKNFVM